MLFKVEEADGWTFFTPDRLVAEIATLLCNVSIPSEGGLR